MELKQITMDMMGMNVFEQTILRRSRLFKNIELAKELIDYTPGFDTLDDIKSIKEVKDGVDIELDDGVTLKCDKEGIIWEVDNGDEVFQISGTFRPDNRPEKLIFAKEGSEEHQFASFKYDPYGHVLVINENDEDFNGFDIDYYGKDKGEEFKAGIDARFLDARCAFEPCDINQWRLSRFDDYDEHFEAHLTYHKDGKLDEVKIEYVVRTLDSVKLKFSYDDEGNCTDVTEDYLHTSGDYSYE